MGVYETESRDPESKRPRWTKQAKQTKESTGVETGGRKWKNEWKGERRKPKKTTNPKRRARRVGKPRRKKRKEEEAK